MSNWGEKLEILEDLEDSKKNPMNQKSLHLDQYSWRNQDVTFRKKILSQK